MRFVQREAGVVVLVRSQWCTAPMKAMWSSTPRKATTESDVGLTRAFGGAHRVALTVNRRCGLITGTGRQRGSDMRVRAGRGVDHTAQRLHSRRKSGRRA